MPVKNLWLSRLPACPRYTVKIYLYRHLSYIATPVTLPLCQERSFKHDWCRYVLIHAPHYIAPWIYRHQPIGFNRITPWRYVRVFTVSHIFESSCQPTHDRALMIAARAKSLTGGQVTESNIENMHKNIAGYPTCMATH